MELKSSFLKVMQERGFIADCTDLAGLDEALLSPGQRAYVGYDLTAGSLHVGHLMNIMVMRWFADCGHRPLLLAGHGTTMVGDPSFKDKARPMLSEAEITGNGLKIVRRLETLMELRNYVVVDNAEWIQKVSLMNYLREIGTHFSVNKMMGFESVKGRVRDGGSISLLEFCYMTLQAWDFDMLALYEGCILQMGGSDQWGNIVNGVELVRKRQAKQVFGLTTPLLTNSAGQKMGKTVNGAVWLDAQMTSPYEFWQFWRNTDDADVTRFLKLFTTMPVHICEHLGSATGSALNRAKEVLADQVTAIVHGDIAAQNAGGQAYAVFSGEGGLEDLPAFEVDANDARLTKVLVQIGFAKNGKDARRYIEGHEVKINGAQVSDPAFFVQDGAIVSIGRKRMGHIKIT